MPDTPLRPHILAAFLPWGGFAGAGRPARRKGSKSSVKYEWRTDLFLRKLLHRQVGVRLEVAPPLLNLII